MSRHARNCVMSFRDLVQISAEKARHTHSQNTYLSIITFIDSAVISRDVQIFAPAPTPNKLKQRTETWA
jgi:hypothetical protein